VKKPHIKKQKQFKGAGSSPGKENDGNKLSKYYHEKGPVEGKKAPSKQPKKIQKPEEPAENSETCEHEG